jgi:hypothetical protein
MSDANDIRSNAATLVFVRDLLFSSRIVEAARAAGVSVRIVRDPAKLVNEPGGRMIVDLNQPGFLDAAAAWKRGTGGEVIAFVAHTDELTIRRAKEVGFERVLSNGAFTQHLPNLMGSAT